MDGTIGEIRVFAGDYAPKDWRLCDGSLLDANEFSELFTLINANFGGDGYSNFALPDMRSRVAVGTGQGGGLANYYLGAMVGAEATTLDTAQMPIHTHAATSTGGDGKITAKATLMASATDSGVLSPENAVLGIDGNLNYSIYAAANTGKPVAMADDALAVSNLSGGKTPVVSLSSSGGNMPHNNIQPYLVVNYIICVKGIFPSRG